MIQKTAGLYGLCAAMALFVGTMSGAACFQMPPEGGQPPPPDARFVGSAACDACHPNIGEWHSITGHAQALKSVRGDAPSYPDVSDRVGLPSPPAPFAWSGLSYVIGGYLKAAYFVDLNGFVLVTGVTGSDVQYNLPVPHALLPGEFVPYLPDQMTALPFDYERFRRVTTGPRTLTESDGLREGNREGIEGTWAEDGVQCEACHGPGSAHVANPSAGLIDVGSSPELCAACHADPDNPLVIPAKDDFIAGAHQYAEVQASPHAGFACTTCHDPHASSTYDRDRGIRNDCMACHGDQNMALHEGLTFVWDDYTEEITCESCHMPFAAQTGAASRFIVAGETVARIGDTRSHIMTIDTDYDDPLEMFTADGSEVLRDEQGRASVTACFACVRCHHGLGNAFRFPPSQVCPSGEGIHEQQGTP